MEQIKFEDVDIRAIPDEALDDIVGGAQGETIMLPTTADPA